MYTDAEGVITTCNDHASRLFGAPKEKLIGFSYRSLKDERIRSAIVAALMGRNSFFEGEYLTVTGNKNTYMHANFSPAFSPEGHVLCVIGIFEDVSGHRRPEMEGGAANRGLRTNSGKTGRPNGFLPICASCKKIKDDSGNWNPFEIYFRDHAGIDFSHGVCPECMKKLYPGRAT